MNFRSDRILLYLSVLLFSSTSILLFLFLRGNNSGYKSSQIIPHAKPSKERMGFFTWSYMHSLLANIECGKDDKMDPIVKKRVLDLISLIQKTFPCPTCSQDFKELLEKYPADHIETKKELGIWLCKLHNLVNVKLKKSEFNCAKLDETYKMLTS